MGMSAIPSGMIYSITIATGGTDITLDSFDQNSSGTFIYKTTDTALSTLDDPTVQ